MCRVAEPAGRLRARQSRLAGVAAGLGGVHLVAVVYAGGVPLESLGLRWSAAAVTPAALTLAGLLLVQAGLGAWSRAPPRVAENGH